MPLAAVPDPPDEGEPPVLDEAERAEKAAGLHACGHSAREVAQLMKLGSQADAQRLIDLGKLAASRRTAEDVRADHIVLTRMLLRGCAQTFARPGPMVDRAGMALNDEDGYALPDETVRMTAAAAMQKLMEREAKLAGADAPAKSISASVSFDAAAMRDYLIKQGVPEALVNMPLERILELTAGSGQPGILEG